MGLQGVGEEGHGGESIRTGPLRNPRHALAPLGRALLDHHLGRARGPLLLRWDTGAEERVDPAFFFREPAALDPLERTSLDACRGRVLDVGAGAGAHALALQGRGLPVTALEVLPEAVRVLRERGVRRVVEGGWEDLAPEPAFDTVLALMNGTGLAGTRAGLDPFLDRLAAVLAPGGALLVDSTDPAAFLDLPDPAGSGAEDGDGRHPGELQLQLSYGGLRGTPFPHLYLAPGELLAAASARGWKGRVVAEEGGTGRWLARLVRPA